MGKHEGAELELVLQSMERWLDELAEVREQLRAIEGVLGLQRVRDALEDRRESIERGLRVVEGELAAMKFARVPA